MSTSMGCTIDLVGRMRGYGRKPEKGHRRKPYAWERSIVKSSIPAGEQMVACATCRVEWQRKEMRLGYCPSCWQQG